MVRTHTFCSLSCASRTSAVWPTARILSSRVSIRASQTSTSFLFASYRWLSPSMASNCVFLCITFEFVSSQCSRSFVTATRKKVTLKERPSSFCLHSHNLPHRFSLKFSLRGRLSLRTRFFVTFERTDFFHQTLRIFLPRVGIYIHVHIRIHIYGPVWERNESKKRSDNSLLERRKSSLIVFYAINRERRKERKALHVLVVSRSTLLERTKLKLALKFAPSRIKRETLEAVQTRTAGERAAGRAERKTLPTVQPFQTRKSACACKFLSLPLRRILKCGDTEQCFDRIERKSFAKIYTYMLDTNRVSSLWFPRRKSLR